MTSKWTRRIILGSAAVATAGVAMGFTLAASTMDDHDGERELRVGVYDPQAAFQQYHAAEELQQRLQEIDSEIQEAQQQQDQERMFQLQSEVEQMHSEVVDRFLEDVEQAMPEITSEHSIGVVAVEYTYVSSEFGEPVDLTDHVVNEINEN